MKKNLAILSISLLLLSCGGSTEKHHEHDSPEEVLTSEQEEAISDQISEEIHSDTEELEQTTEQSLQEVDSLLNEI